MKVRCTCGARGKESPGAREGIFFPGKLLPVSLKKL